MLGEADTRFKLIDPARNSIVWTEEFTEREEMSGSIEIGDRTSAAVNRL